MPPEDDKNRIEELKKSLYSRTAPEVRTRRKLRFGDMATEVKSSWQEPQEEEAPPVELNSRYEDRSMSFLTKLFIGSGVFCLFALGIGAYLFFNGTNLISGDNIDVAITGPVSIPGGEPVAFGIKITNKNNIDLENVDMNIAFPPGATDPKDSLQSLTSYDQYIGELSPGGATTTDVSAIIFGEENTQKTITATFTYKVKGSSALFTKVARYDVLINSSPISVTVSSFENVPSGQEFDMTVKLKSNSQDVLKGVLLKADYPFGYTFISANLPPLSDNMTWKIGDIPPGGERTVVVHGKLQGSDADTRVFKFAVGARGNINSSVIGTQYSAVSQSVTIEKSFITLGLSFDNDNATSDYVGRFGSPIRVTLSWFNNLSVSVSNAVISVDLSGSAYDKAKINPDLGYFDSSRNRIIWNQQTNPSLETIGAGDNGTVTFLVTPTKSSTASANQLINPVLKVSANISANRTQESNVSGTLTAGVSRAIKVASNISLGGRVVRSVGPFVNTGPIPPKAEQATTYTVIWSVSNTTSSVSGAQVSATLPAYISWMGKTSPSTEDISYDQNSGTVTWNLGSVSPSSISNDSTSRREVAFQISFTPSITQINSLPTLVNQATLTATDDYTGASLTSQQDFLMASFSTDPAYKSGDETVVQ